MGLPTLGVQVKLRDHRRRAWASRLVSASHGVALKSLLGQSGGLRESTGNPYRGLGLRV